MNIPTSTGLMGTFTSLEYTSFNMGRVSTVVLGDAHVLRRELIAASISSTVTFAWFDFFLIAFFMVLLTFCVGYESSEMPGSVEPLKICFLNC
jgi:bacteriorhodopsin